MPYPVLHNVRGSEVEMENIFTSLSQPGNQGKMLLNLGKLQPCYFTLVGEKHQSSELRLRTWRRGAPGSSLLGPGGSETLLGESCRKTVAQADGKRELTFVGQVFRPALRESALEEWARWGVGNSPARLESHVSMVDPSILGE